MKKKHRAEEPEHPLDQVLAQQAAEEIIERLHHPLGEVLETRGHQRHLAGRRLAEQDDQAHREPDHDAWSW